MSDVVMWEYRAEWYASVSVYKTGTTEAVAEMWEPFLMASTATAVQVIYRRPRETPAVFSEEQIKGMVTSDFDPL